MDGQDPLSLPFTGAFLIAPSRPTADGTPAVSGRVTVRTDRPDDGTERRTGFSLSGSLDGGELTVERLVASDRTDPAAGTVFQSPESPRADRAVLTRV